MKRVLFLAALVCLTLAACNQQKSAELYIPKNTVEFAGNAFTSFSLGADVKLYSAPDPDNASKYAIHAVVPVRKEMQGAIPDLSINLTPLDDRSIRVREGLVLEGEDLVNLVPVYNASSNVERTIVFSVPAGPDGSKKLFSAKEAAELLKNTKGVRMDFNISNAAAPVVQKPAAAPAQEEYPMTLDGLCRKYGVYGLLARYNNALRDGNKKGAKRIEDQLWDIEKKVKADPSVPKWLQDRFKDYVEDKEDEIEDRY